MSVLILKLTIIYALLALNFIQVFCVPYNSEYEEGDGCKLDNNVKGICQNIKNCEYAMNLIAQRKYSEISRCRFRDRQSIICCPKKILQKSEKFEKALCQGKYVKKQTFGEITFKIIAGEEAGVGEFPFQVALGYRNQDGSIEYNCGGSLIADDIVLTAAHCVNRRDTSPVTVKLGRVSLVPDEEDYGDGEDIEIQNITIHSNYSRWTNHNDIAMIKLKHPTNFTWPIDTICLSTNETDLPKNFTITGYGRKDVTTDEKSNWLMTATVNIHPFEKCQQLFEQTSKKIVDNQVCAIGYKGADACKGDSGGPLSFRREGVHYLHGIVSFGSACGSPLPGIYIKVSKYLKWIETEMIKFEQNERNIE